jgi:hypothetical protein
MSTPNPQPPTGAISPGPPPPPPPPPPEPARREIRVISHCALFYWWPVWLVGFIMGTISFFSGHVMAVVPSGTTPREGLVKAQAGDKEDTDRDVLVLPRAKKLPKQASNKDVIDTPHLHISENKNLGVVFVGVLLLVIVITNIPLRGLWSVIVIVVIAFLVILFALLDWWNTILDWLTILDIRITAGGYFAISIVLFFLWLVIMLVFDRQIYMVFTPGQMRVRQEIGDAEMTFDTTGMSVQKQRSDLFRHWILGLGSGDLIVKTHGANAQEIQMPNVLFVGRKVTEIEQMLAERAVVPGTRGS